MAGTSASSSSSAPFGAREVHARSVSASSDGFGDFQAAAADEERETATRNVPHTPGLDGGNVDSYIDDDDDGWHDADLVAGFSPTSPVQVTTAQMSRPHGTASAASIASAPRSVQPNSAVAQHQLGGDLDWEAWETPRGPTPSSEQQHGGDLDLLAAFRQASMKPQSQQQRLQQSPSSREENRLMPRASSPPMIDLREMEKKLDGRRQGAQQQQRSADILSSAAAPPSATTQNETAQILQQADLDFFEAFESKPRDVMATKRSESRNRRKLQGAQLDNMAEAQASPMSLATPAAGGESGNSYFEQGRQAPSPPTSPISMPQRDNVTGSPRLRPDSARPDSQNGSWSEAAGSWAGSFRRTLGSLRGHLPTAKDFYVSEDEGNQEGERETRDNILTAASGDSAQRLDADDSFGLPHHKHSRKVANLEDYSQSTPFGGAGHDHLSPPSLSPPLLRTMAAAPPMPHHAASAPISGAPGFDPNVGRNWNTGSWSLTSKDEIERAKKPIPVELRGRREETQDVVDSRLAAQLTPYLPRRLQLGKSWKLLYSSDQHGISLGTLYWKVESGLNASRFGRSGGNDVGGGVSEAEGWLRGASETTRAAITGVPKVGGGLNLREAGLVLAVRDSNDRVFGSFVNERLRPQSSYYGSGECFLWKQADSGAVKTYKSTGRNDYMVLTEAHYLSFGGGEGKYGLWVDGHLDQGISSRCPAFDNDVLCDGREKSPAPASDDSTPEETFECIVLEVWACGID